MGTSSMYNGYSDGNNQRNPLLPDDFNDSNNDNNQNPQDDTNSNPESKNSKDEKWKDVKTNFSKLASGSNKSLKGAVSKYVKAYGGSKSATKNAISGVQTTIRLGDFLGNASSQGFAQALQGIKLDFKNKSTTEVLTDLINYLAPNPITKEDSIARKALIITMEKLYELIEKENMDIELIGKLDENTLSKIVPLYVENYIYERLINDLGSRIEENCTNSASAVKLEKELKDYINSKVEITFKGLDIVNTSFSKEKIESIYNQCYNVMEDLK